MNDLVETGEIREMKCGENFAFILNDKNALAHTEYKVLQSQSDGNFVRCTKVLYNGKTQLYYMPNGDRAFSSMASALDVETFLAVVRNLLTDIEAVKKNGFLSCQKLDISFEHIFVNALTYKISLVYLPIERRMYEDVTFFENELRANLIKLIQAMPNLKGTKIDRLKMNLSDGRIALRDVLEGTDSRQGKGHMKLIAINVPVPLEIDISKDIFILGRKEEWVDAVVSSSKRISRKHCQIIWEGNDFKVMNLSGSGTYVNQKHLKNDESCVVKDGDIIRMVFLEFKVIIN